MFGEQLSKKYKKGPKISQGAFGTVYQIQNVQQQNSSQLLAAKQVFHSSNNIQRQLRLLKQLPSNHNIINVKQIIQGKLTTWIIMQRGDFDLLKWMSSVQYPIDQIYVKKLAIDILSGLKHLHSHGIIHRDLKPSNILVKNQGKQLMICDLGSAVKYDGKNQYQIQGFTRWYKPPQMMFGDRTYGYQVDIWSLGCILMEVSTGQPFFCGKSQLQQLALITNCLGDPSPQNWPSVGKLSDHGKITFKKKRPQSIQQIQKQRGISKELCQFIMSMVKYEKRLTVQQLINHEYLKTLQNTQFKLGHLKPKIK